MAAGALTLSVGFADSVEPLIPALAAGAEEGDMIRTDTIISVPNNTPSQARNFGLRNVLWFNCVWAWNG